MRSKLFELKTPSITLPECYGRYGFERRRCIQCIVDVGCMASIGGAGLQGKLPYGPADAARRLVISEAFAKEQIYLTLAKLYHIARSSAMTYTRVFSGWRFPSDFQGAIDTMRVHLIGRSAKVFWFDPGLGTSLLAYFRSEFPQGEFQPEYEVPYKAKRVITRVNNVDKYIFSGRFRTVYILKHPFEDHEQPDLIDRILAVEKRYRITYWRFPRAPLHVAIIER